MTIAAAYLTSDGLVIGADSTTTVSSHVQGGNPAVTQLLNHAQKVFEIGQTSAGRFGLCTWGDGKIGNASHRILVARLNDALLATDTVIDVKDKFIGIVTDELRGTAGTSGVGYFIGGCDPQTHVPGCWNLWFENNALSTESELAIGQVSFAGAPEFFNRVFHGCDSNFPDLLKGHLINQIPEIAQIPDIDNQFKIAIKNTVQQLCAAGFSDVPIREAIDFVHMYLHVTIKAFKFRAGPPVCGGPIEIGFITSDRPYRWVRHKDFDTAIFEQLGGINV